MNDCIHKKTCGLEHCLPEVAAQGIECPDYSKRIPKIEGKSADGKYSVQIIRPDIIKQRCDVRSNLYKEIELHDMITASSWYELSKRAYDKYCQIIADNDSY